jgi:hypothetical protein
MGTDQHPEDLSPRSGVRAILDQAGVEALAEMFPQWRVWADERGWHARRQVGEGYAQSRRAGVPVYYVTAQSAAGLAAQLCWQQAADAHTPQGCSTVSPPGCGPGSGRVQRAS